MKNHTSECSEVRERLPLLPGGDLEAPLAEQVEAHLAVCGPCSAELQRLRAALSALAGYQRRDPAIDIWASVRERLVEGGLLSSNRDALTPVAPETAPRALLQAGARRSVAARVGVFVALAAAAAVVIWFGARAPSNVVKPMGMSDSIVLGPQTMPANSGPSDLGGALAGPGVDAVDPSADSGSSVGFGSPARFDASSVAIDVSPVQAGGLRRAQGEERLREVAVPFDASNGRSSNVTLAADREVR